MLFSTFRDIHIHICHLSCIHDRGEAAAGCVLVLKGIIV